MDSRYREKFFKTLADLLALSVYTIFCTCFPQSHMTHFNDEFKEFLCNTTHSWIGGKKKIKKKKKYNFIFRMHAFTKIIFSLEF